MFFRRRRPRRKRFSDKLIDLAAESFRTAGSFIGHLLSPLDNKWQILTKMNRARSWHLKQWNKLNGTTKTE